MLDQLLSPLLALLAGSFITIPINNTLGVIFVVLNGILLVGATILSAVSGGSLPF